MNRVTVLAFLVSVVIPCAAQAARWADELFPERQHDFGKIERGAKAAHDFVLINNTRREVRIKSIRVSCSCTKAVATTGRIDAGGTTILSAVMDTSGFQGSKAVTIYVRLDRPWPAEITLRVQCESVGKLGAEATEIDFGIINQGATPFKKINLDYTGPIEWRVTDLDFGNPNFATEIRETERSPERTRYELDIRLKAGALPGVIEDTIRVHTNDPEMPVVVVKAKAQVEADVVVSPSAISLGPLKPGETVERKLMIKAANPFHVVRLDNGEGVMKFTSNSEAKTVQLVTLSFTAPSSMDDLPRHVDIVTDLDGERVLSIDIDR